MPRTRQVFDDIVAVVRARWYLRGAEVCAERVRVHGRPAVTTRGELIVRDRVRLVSTVARLELVVERGAVLEIGRRSLVNFGTSIVALERVTVGERCLIGPHCMIMDTGFHDVDPSRRLEPPIAKPIVIGDNVWLGARVVVLPGVTIGDDSVVAVGSIVTKNVAPRTLVAGNPARVIRSL